MGRLENPIQTAILIDLQYEENKGHAYAIRNNSFAGRIKRQDGSLGFIKNNKRGAPDIITCLFSTFVAIELKYKTGKQSEFQKEAQEAIERAGGEYWLIRSLDRYLERKEELRNRRCNKSKDRK